MFSPTLGLARVWSTKPIPRSRVTNPFTPPVVSAGSVRIVLGSAELAIN